jgi:hypothetical protein
MEFDSVAVMFVFVVLLCTIVGWIAYSGGETRGVKKGHDLGVDVGAQRERLDWINKARAAEAAGHPWYGVELPPFANPEDEVASENA